MSENDNRQMPKRKLYRIPNKAKVCGVCAGLAEYFGFEVWVIRIIAFSLLVLNWFNGTVVLVYFVLYFVLDPKPGSEKKSKQEKRFHHANSAQHASDSEPYRTSVKDVWSYGASPKELIEKVENKFSEINYRLQNMESYVTSSQFELEREFNKM